MPRTTRADAAKAAAAPKKSAVKKAGVKKSPAKAGVKKSPPKTKAKTAVKAPKNASKVDKSTGSRVVPGKKKSGTKTKAQKDEEKKKQEEEDKSFEEEQRKREEHTKKVNERLKREREEIEAKALAIKKQLEPNEKGERVVPLEKMSKALELVIEEGKTPLVVDPSGRADTFFKYQSVQIVDAKAVFLKHGVHKTMTLDETMDDLRKRTVNAMKNGMYLYICMQNGATDFSNQYNGENTFPIEKILSGWKPTDQEEVEHLLKDADKDHNGFFLPKEGYQPIITTQFEQEDYREFLQASIPMGNLGVIVIEKNKK